MGAGYRKFVAAFDLHGDMQCSRTVNAMLRFCAEFKPHDRIMGGDIWDMRPLRGKASAEEKRESLQADFDAGYAFLEQFRPTSIILGNHDKRLWDHADAVHGPISDLARSLVSSVEQLAGRLRSPILPYDKQRNVLKLGQLSVLHGFQGTIKRHAEVYGPCIYGHVHSADHVVLPRHGGRCEAWSSPCLCQPEMDYNSATIGTLRYDTGFMYGTYSDTDYHVCTATAKNGKIVVATELRAMAA